MSRSSGGRIARGPTLVVLLVVASLMVGPADLNAGANTPEASMAQLWTEPPAGRDLVVGVGGRRLMPDPRDVFKVIEIKASGFSDGYTVVDGAKREWSAKFPPEASPEVVASRLLWGIGFHQPPIYLVAEWRAVGADDPNPQREARFRQKKPDLHGLSDKGPWSYEDNPFVGTRPLNGLLVLNVMLGNSDLKDTNNAIYELDRPFEGASRWYVARDLGQTFGRTGVLDAPRGDIDVFEKTPFIRGVTDGHVVFEYHGHHQNLFKNISVADVEWICRRLTRLSDRQWRDAFRAGGYSEPLASRFIRRLKAKVAEGLALAASREHRP